MDGDRNPNPGETEALINEKGKEKAHATGHET
jgi:hypothetical protein